MQSFKWTFLIATLLMASTTAIHAQEELSHSLRKVVQQMAAQNSYESSRVGYAGIKSAQYIRFEKLLSRASEQQLVQLATVDTNAVVRLYALQALRYKGTVIADNLQQRFSKDTTKVETLMGCLGGRQTVQSLASSILQQPIPANNAFNPKER